MYKNDTQSLIQSLTDGLQPIKLRTAVWKPTILWLGLSWCYVVWVALQLGPFREGALQAMLEVPQFALESAIGFMAGGAFAGVAVLESIPGAGKRWLLWSVLFIFTLWVGSYGFGLVSPALEPSMVGKRAHCVIEAYLYSVPPLILGYALLFYRYPLHSVRMGVFLGISAGAIPALLMQFACMYMPGHILTHHIGPIIPIAALGGGLGYLFRKNKIS